MKRIISVLLSFAIMLTALCIPAFAEGETGGSGNIDVNLLIKLIRKSVEDN